MQVEIDVEKIIIRGIIDGMLNSSNIQRETENILRSEEYQKVLSEHIKTRLEKILFSEFSQEQIDKSIIEAIANSDSVQNQIEQILDGEECQTILQQQVKTCLVGNIYSEDGKKQMLKKIEEYLENYDIESDDKVTDELSKMVTDVLMMTMKDSLKRLKTANKQ